MKKKKLKFILDFDGVFTDGKFLYGKNGKMFKVFGPHDSDAIKIIKNYYDTSLISADKNGFEISKKRALDMGLKISLVSEDERYIYFTPNLSRATSDNSIVVFKNPKIRVILKSDVQEYALGTNNLYKFSLNLEEALA